MAILRISLSYTKKSHHYLSQPHTATQQLLDLMKKGNQGTDELCKCGCRGWCTQWPIALCIAWDLWNCAAGRLCQTDEYGKQMERAECILPFIVAVLELRCDWPAWNEMSGVRFWNHRSHPCPKCSISKALMHTCSFLGDIASGHEPHEKYGHQQYLEDIARSKVATSQHSSQQL